MRALEKMADFMILSFLWILCCIPVITIGPATSALYYVTLKIVRKEDNGIVKPFFHALKDNLLPGMVQTVIFLVGTVCFFLNYRLIGFTSGALRIVLMIVYWVLFVCCICTVIYTFAVQAQFRNRITATIRNAFLLALERPLLAIVILIIHILPGLFYLVSPSLCMRALPVFICLGPAVIAYLSARNFVKIFDPLIKESLACEQEQQAQAETLS